MTRTDILARAGGEGGPVVTISKAAMIVATGGRITVCAVDPDGKNLWGLHADVSGGSVWKIEDPSISWSGLYGQGPAQAKAQAACVRAAAEIAELAKTDPGIRFDHAPQWVHAELAHFDWTEEDACFDAARRYHAGDVDWAGAWRWVVKQIKEKGATA